jgi:hypothetical protein
MRPLICIVKEALRVWWMTALCVVLLAGCKTYVPVETVRVETERVVDIQRDSIYVLDSVFVREVLDSVFVTRWRVEYKEALRVDTLNIERVDTLNTIVEVEKKLTRVQQLKMDIGAGVLYAVPILIAVGLFVLYRKFKK